MVCGSDVWEKGDTVDTVDGLQDVSLQSLRHGVHGTRAILAHTGGPICSVNLIFATEASDNKGLPHCLEHLCFMGSQKYPRGYLDLLATRCGSDGTNAYTESDHTCYSFEVAGETGLLAILPVFIDHVLCPLLTPDAYLTEIHHVNGKGERQGVVYSEMLGRVSDEAEILDLERRRAVFGDSSPYSYEHGGLPNSIRQLTREEVADYHSKVYTTDNLRVLVSGSFDAAKVLGALGTSLDAAVAGNAQQSCEKQPFVSALAELPASCPRRRTIKFPTNDLSVGSVVYSRRLDGIAFDDVSTIAALDCLGRFLVGVASSPLEQAFVQCDPPIASGVVCEATLTAEPCITIELTGVPFHASCEELKAAKRLGDGEDGDDEDDDGDDDDDDDDGKGDDEGDDAEDGDSDGGEGADDGTDWFAGDTLLQRLVQALSDIHDALSSGSESTIKELQRAVKKEAVARGESFEDGPDSFLREALCPHLIFDSYPARSGHGGGGGEQEGPAASQGPLRVLSARHAALAALPAKGGQWWADLLSTHLLLPLKATLAGTPGGAAEVRSCPSALSAMEACQQEEKAAKQNKKALGKAKLKSMQERVDLAEQANQISLSPVLRDGFPGPASPDCVPDLKWSMELREPPEGGLEVLEVEVPSAFVELHIIWQLDDKALPGRLRRYLPLFTQLICETNVAGEDYRSVVARLDDELVSYGANIGCGSEFLHVGSHPDWFTLRLSAEPANAPDLAAWADRLAHECDFSEEKVLATCRRVTSEVKESMREGETVLTQALPSAFYGPLSPQVQYGAFSQKPFLERCCKDVAGTCQALRDLRAAITAPGTAAVAVLSGRAAECRRSTAELLQQAWGARHAAARPRLLRAFEWGSGARPGPGPPLLPLRRFVVGCAGADTANIHLRVALPSPTCSPEDGKRSWSLRLLCEALSMMEGPLAMAVRGKGLAYGAYVGFSEYANAVALHLIECTNVRKAIEAAMEVLRGAADGDGLSPFQLDNARGSLVYQIKGRRATPTNIVDAAVATASRGLHSVAEVHAWEEQLGAVTREDVLAAHADHLLQLCDPSRAVACVVCSPAECKAKAKALAAALGVEKDSVHTQESAADCYGIVDARVRAALEQAGP